MTKLGDMTRLWVHGSGGMMAGSLQILVTPDLIRGPWSGPAVNAGQSATRAMDAETSLPRAKSKGSA